MPSPGWRRDGGIEEAREGRGADLAQRLSQFTQSLRLFFRSGGSQRSGGQCGGGWRSVGWRGGWCIRGSSSRRSGSGIGRGGGGVGGVGDCVTLCDFRPPALGLLLGATAVAGRRTTLMSCGSCGGHGRRDAAFGCGCGGCGGGGRHPGEAAEVAFTSAHSGPWPSRCLSVSCRGGASEKNKRRHQVPQSQPPPGSLRACCGGLVGGQL